MQQAAEMESDRLQSVARVREKSERMQAMQDQMNAMQKWIEVQTAGRLPNTQHTTTAPPPAEELLGNKKSGDASATKTPIQQFTIHDPYDAGIGQETEESKKSWYEHRAKGSERCVFEAVPQGALKMRMWKL